MKKISLILSATIQWGRIAIDAAADISGRSLSFDPAVISQPHSLNQIINEHGVEPLTARANIQRVEQLAIPSVSSNCNNLVLRLEQHQDSLLPDSIFVKLPSPSLVTRWFFNIIESWKLECYFFKHVAKTLPIRTPITYAATTLGTRFCLIQENLNADNSVQLFTNFDMLEGPSLERAKRCLDTFARIHATHFDMSESDRLALMPLDHHPFFGGNMRTVSQALNKMGLSPCVKKHPQLMNDELVALYKKTLDNWDALLAHWFAGPLSLCHGDSHLGNFFEFENTHGAREMGMLDFQAAHWGNGIRDVQYFLIDSLPADVLTEHEQQLIRYYVERRGVHGTAIDFDESWQQYRALSFHSWMTIVVSIGFAAMNEEQDGLMTEILRRSIAAIERVGYAQWLDEFITSGE